MSHGKLEVCVESAVDIKDTDIIGEGSPYCTLTTGSHERSTPPIAEGGSRPCFNTKLESEVDSTTEQLTRPASPSGVAYRTPHLEPEVASRPPGPPPSDGGLDSWFERMTAGNPVQIPNFELPRLPFNPKPSKRGMTEKDSSSKSSDDDNALAPHQSQSAVERESNSSGEHQHQ